MAQTRTPTKKKAKIDPEQYRFKYKLLESFKYFSGSSITPEQTQCAKDCLQHGGSARNRYSVLNFDGIRQCNEEAEPDKYLQIMESAYKLLLKITVNLLRHNRPLLWRLIRTSSPAFKARVDCMLQARDILRMIGYKVETPDSMCFPEDVSEPDREHLRKVAADLLMAKYEVEALREQMSGPASSRSPPIGRANEPRPPPALPPNHTPPLPPRPAQPWPASSQDSRGDQRSVSDSMAATPSRWEFAPPPHQECDPPPGQEFDPPLHLELASGEINQPGSTGFEVFPGSTGTDMAPAWKHALPGLAAPLERYRPPLRRQTRYSGEHSQPVASLDSQVYTGESATSHHASSDSSSPEFSLDTLGFPSGPPSDPLSRLKELKRERQRVRNIHKANVDMGQSHNQPHPPAPRALSPRQATCSTFSTAATFASFSLPHYCSMCKCSMRPQDGVCPYCHGKETTDEAKGGGPQLSTIAPAVVPKPVPCINPPAKSPACSPANSPAVLRASFDAAEAAIREHHRTQQLALVSIAPAHSVSGHAHSGSGHAHSGPDHTQLPGFHIGPPSRIPTMPPQPPAEQAPPPLMGGGACGGWGGWVGEAGIPPRSRPTMPPQPPTEQTPPPIPPRSRPTMPPQPPAEQAPPPIPPRSRPTPMALRHDDITIVQKPFLAAMKSSDPSSPQTPPYLWFDLGDEIECGDEPESEEESEAQQKWSQFVEAHFWEKEEAWKGHQLSQDTSPADLKPLHRERGRPEGMAHQKEPLFVEEHFREKEEAWKRHQLRQGVKPADLKLLHGEKGEALQCVDMLGNREEYQLGRERKKIEKLREEGQRLLHWVKVGLVGGRHCLGNGAWLLPASLSSLIRSIVSN